MRPVRFGRASVTRVLELRFDLATRLFAQTPPSGWRDNADLLVPDFFDPSTDQWHIAIQSWVIEVDGFCPPFPTPVVAAADYRHFAPPPPRGHPDAAQRGGSRPAAWRPARVRRQALRVQAARPRHSRGVTPWTRPKSLLK